MNLIERNKEMKEFFNKVVNIDYDEKHSAMIEAKRKIVDFIPVNTKKIIDLGAGTGLQLIRVYEVFPNVKTIAIDISDGMLKKLKERNISDNIVIVNESFFDYDFGSDIDAVISTQALHHFEPKDKLALYKKVYECLKNEGVFVCEDYFAFDDEYEKMGFENYKSLVYGPESHYDTPLTISHETDILRSAGFENVDHFDGGNFNVLVAKKSR